MRRLEITDDQARALLHAARKALRKRADDMPDEPKALNALFRAWLRLKDLGWQEAMYAPRDRKVFVIEAGSTGIYQAQRGVEGHWWVEDAGDLWPASPILFKEILS